MTIDFRVHIGWTAAAALVLAVGCGSGDDSGECTGKQLLPSQSPVGLGSLYPLAGNDPEPNTGERTPVEFVLLLNAQCGEPVAVQKVCVSGGNANQFLIEDARPSTARPGEPAAVRVTYQRQDVGGPDQTAIVVQSEAENFPTLVVPLCAQVVADGSELTAVVCDSPITVADGARDDSLCP